MSYSIFENTMADMNYQQIEEAAKQNQAVIFPIAVIEEHGPHLCLGTDTYLTYNQCSEVKLRLENSGLESLIAPPFYWGINQATGGFAGSFTVKESTMVGMLCDIFECLKKWGFRNIYLFNFHGDFKHNMTIINAAKKAYEELGAGVYFIVPEFFLRRAGLNGSEPYLLVQKFAPAPEDDIKPQFLDIHAGGSETSLMLRDFPDMVDLEKAKSLGSSCTTFEGLRIWQQGGEKAKEVTPLGYCGNPSDINLDMADRFESEMIESMADIIAEHYKSTNI